VAHPTVANTLYAGTERGVYKTTDGGAHWNEVTQSLGSPLVRVLAQDPNSPATVYVGTFGKGILKSTDEGASWIALPVSETGIAISAFAIASGNPSTFYAGTASGRGVLKSANSTQSWKAINTGLPGASVLALAQDPVDPLTLYAAVWQMGVLKSRDGGKTWTPGIGVSVGFFRDRLYVDPQDRNILYVLSEEGLYKTTDSGNSWTLLFGGFGAIALAIDPRDSRRVYLAEDDSHGGITSGGVFKSEDGGATWGRASSGFYEPRLVALALDPQQPDTLFAISAGSYDQGLYKSSDAAENWLRIGGGPSGYYHQLNGITVDPHDSNVLYDYDFDAGVFKSVDGGLQWTPLRLGPSNGYTSVVLDPDSINMLYASQRWKKLY